MEDPLREQNDKEQTTVLHSIVLRQKSKSG